MNAAPKKPKDDPVLAMARLWNRDRDLYEKTLRLAAERERILLDASPAKQDEAKRLFDAASDTSAHVGEQLDRLTHSIFCTRSRTFEAALAKFAIVIRDGAPSARSDEAPWPYLRNVFADFERLLQKAAANDSTSANR